MAEAGKQPTPVKKVKKTSEEAGGKKQEQKKFPSPFGSHASMVQQEVTAEVQKQHPQLAVLEDENGQYVTETARLDTRMADPNRYAGEKHRHGQLEKAGVKVAASKKE